MTLSGIWVPLITPMQGGRVDTVSLKRLCGHLMDQGVSGLVACGTTGEAPLLSAEERREVIATVAEAAGPDTMAGAGTMSTEETVDLVRQAAEAGARTVLVITPFFMAPTQAEMTAHYRAVADASPVPVVIYNFPARTGAPIKAGAVLELAAHRSIVGTKQSVASLDPDLQQVILGGPEGFAVLVGAAPLLWPALALGAAGGILAAAHVEAPALLEVFRRATAGDLAGAQAVHRDLYPRLASVEGPSVIKRRLHEMGVIASPEMRAPLGTGESGLRG